MTNENFTRLTGYHAYSCIMYNIQRYRRDKDVSILRQVLDKNNHESERKAHARAVSIHPYTRNMAVSK